MKFGNGPWLLADETYKPTRMTHLHTLNSQILFCPFYGTTFGNFRKIMKLKLGGYQY